MADPINLNKARKAHTKAMAKTEASQNRIRFGRTKGEKARQVALADKLAREVDAHKRQP